MISGCPVDENVLTCLIHYAPEVMLLIVLALALSGVAAVLAATGLRWRCKCADPACEAGHGAKRCRENVHGESGVCTRCTFSKWQRIEEERRKAGN